MEELKEVKKISDSDIVAMADGELGDIADVSDPIFVQKMMGESIAFSFEDDIVDICSPANGILTAMAPTRPLVLQ